MRKKIAIALIFVLGVIAFVQNSVSFAGATGGFEITYLDLPLNGPVFNIQGMLPGDCFTREVEAKNNGNEALNLSVKAADEEDSDALSTQISFEIKEGSNVYFSNTLDNFYSLQSLSLGSIPKNVELTYTFKACFLTTAGNEYQNTKTSFNLVFSTKHGNTPPPNQLPFECKNMHIEKYIIGDSGNNHLKGSSKREFIDGKNGNDHIEGRGNNDCLVGGEGNDKIEGGSGRDVVLGNEGNDDLRGGTGNDYLDGGPGNDTLFGNSGSDKCLGENLHSCEL